MTLQTVPELPADVARVFDSYPAPIRKKLMVVRALVFDVAGRTEGVGKLTETLKWGEPAYLTSQTRSGSTVRIGWRESEPDQYAIFLNCNTRLVGTFRRQFSDELEFEGNRAIVFNRKARLPRKAVRACIEMALTYHLRKR